VKKSYVAIIVASMLSGLGIATYARGSRNEQQRIDLSALYKPPFKDTGSNEGNFLETDDGTIVFFNPAMRAGFRQILNGQITSLPIPVMLYRDTVKIKPEEINISKVGSTLLFGKLKARSSEIDRLKLSPEWDKMYKFFGRGTNSGLTGCSVIRLKNGLFLISGDVSIGGKATDQFRVKTALVYDGNSDSIIKSIPMPEFRRRHNSIELSDGKVALIGGVSVGMSLVEIVDISTGTSSPLALKAVVSRIATTACLDLSGNCIVMGGADRGDDCTLIERIDLNSGSLTRLENLPKCRKYFDVPQRVNFIPCNSLALKSGKILISGGLTRSKGFSDENSTREDADILLLP